MKKLSLSLTITISLVFLSLVLNAQPEESPKGFRSEVEIISKDGTQATMVTLGTQENSRMEMYEGRGKDKKLTMIHICKKDLMIMLDPQSKSGTKMSMKSMGKAESSKSKEGPKTNDWKEWMNTEGKKMGISITKRGTEKWDGCNCDVYRVTDSSTKTFLDYYVDTKDNIIKRWISYDSKGEQEAEMRIVKFEKNIAIPKDAFDVPPGYQVQDLSNMMMPQSGSQKKP